MSGFDANIVREYFELNGFFVRLIRKYKKPSPKKRSDALIEFLVDNPTASTDGVAPGFQLFSADMLKITRAAVVVKAWHSTRFTPAMLRSSTRVFEFLKKDVLPDIESYFDFEGSDLTLDPTEPSALTRILVLPGLPASDPQRSESIELLKAGGVDGIITFSTILENLLRHVEVNHSYDNSDLLQLLRVLKIYDMVKEPQMHLFN